MKYAESVYEAASDTDTLLIPTDWARFAALDLKTTRDSALPDHDRTGSTCMTGWR